MLGHPNCALLLLATLVVGRDLSSLQARLLMSPELPWLTSRSGADHSLNVSSCPGYTLSDLQNTKTGLTAHLSLAGVACNAFGNDVANLTIQARLHVNIFDTANQQFTVPQNVVARPAPPTAAVASPDLVFNFNAKPFAFWITRRDSPDGAPLFDTRTSSLPKTPIPAVIAGNPSTALDGFPLVFEDQYLQLTSALPLGANVYGLGEVLASSGFRRDVGTDGGVGTVQTMWARDAGNPVDANVYGSHPIYLEHRVSAAGTPQTHGVFLMSAAGADILLLTPAGARQSLIEYRMIGGVLDFYFFSGASPQAVIEQYGALVGLPAWQPVWGFGFHLCRWGYANVSETKEQVTRMRQANIPLEVMWNDIDIYHAYRDFTTDPGAFPPSELKAFIAELASNNQHYIPIVDAAIAKETNATDKYDIYDKGVAQKVFMTNPDGSQYIGQVWPGYTVFPDWFANNTQAWWTASLKEWRELGVAFSGIWLDMNEVSSFCDGSCGTGADLSNTSVPFLLPGAPGNPVTDYPEGYDSAVSGPSGNITVNGTLTFGAGGTLARRGLGAANQTGININTPPYTINNGFGPLSIHAVATNATHATGYAELDTHNLWGLMEERATHHALNALLPGQRPFIIARSTFASAGKWAGHWLGDNNSKWEWMYLSIQGILQFSVFQIPMVGADTCGFNGNTDEELCNRWMSMSAFTPFYRNHNLKTALPQEPYRWDSVAQASRVAIGVRYAMLPYWYTLFANASLFGTPPMRALWYEFPDEPELFGIDRQFMVGSNILVTPVLTPNVTTVDGILPGRGKTVWRDWYTYAVVSGNSGTNTTLAAPLSHINVHLRDGSVMLLHAAPGYTVEETRAGPFSLLVSQTASGGAFGSAFLDDGVSFPPGPSTTLTITAKTGQVTIKPVGKFHIAQPLSQVTVLGVAQPKAVFIDGMALPSSAWAFTAAIQQLVISKMSTDLNSVATITWH